MNLIRIFDDVIQRVYVWFIYGCTL